MNLKLGKHGPKIHPQTLQFKKYLLSVPTPPAAISWQSAVKQWPIYLNDQLGDCVFASGGHIIENWTANATTEFSPSDDDVLKAYEAVGGYQPGKPYTDNGAAITDFLAYWRTTGLAGHKIDGWAQVDQASVTEIKQAIFLFGAVDLGVVIHQSDMNQFNAGQKWDNHKRTWLDYLFNYSDPVLGGHSIPAFGYDSNYIYTVTWGKVQAATWHWFLARCDESYGAVSMDFIKQNGIAPNKFNLAQLEQDLAALKA